jgi:hypothetical protein
MLTIFPESCTYRGFVARQLAKLSCRSVIWRESGYPGALADSVDLLVGVGCLGGSIAPAGAR